MFTVAETIVDAHNSCHKMRLHKHANFYCDNKIYLHVYRFFTGKKHFHFLVFVQNIHLMGEKKSRKDTRTNFNNFSSMYELAE